MQISFMQRGGDCVAYVDMWTIDNDETDVVAEPSRLLDLRRRVYATVARYRQERRCTDAEVRTIDALWIDGSSLRAHARQEGVRPQAISARINSLANKAPEFYRWWRLKNTSHRRR